MSASQSGTLPIGVFDSGKGGLSVLRVMRDAMPDESVIYLGDTARMPYGPKSGETIIRYAREAVAHLVDSGVKAVVIACNTVTTAALETLRAEYPDLPLIGVVEPGARAAAALTRNGRIAVAGTLGTIRSGAHARLIKALRPGTEVIGIAAPLFVPLAEEGWMEGPASDAVAERYLAPVFGAPEDRRPDCLLLGCTHFPFLVSSIAKAVGPGVALADPAELTVRELQRVLTEKGFARAGTRTGRYEYRVSSEPELFAQVGGLFMNAVIAPEDIRLTELGPV